MRAISAAINRHVILPAYYWKNGDKRLARLSDLEKSQWLNPVELEDLQASRLRALIRHCYKHTSYYRRIFDEAKIDPRDIRDRNDLRHLPILTKAAIQDYGDSMISNHVPREHLVADASGGSTGMPTNFFKDLDRHRLRLADQIRHDQWCGWQLGEPYALLWGAQRDLSLVQSFKERMIARLVDRSFLFDAFEIRESELDSMLDRLRKIKPVMLLGYANALYLFAQQVDQSQKVIPESIKGIISSAETLSDEKRKFIEKVLRRKVLNRYGSREVGLIASECGCQQGLHINSENVVVEILDGDDIAGPGRRGEIVVTDLMNFGMPFIRYRMGDCGYLSDASCACGRGLPLLGAVEGRVSDFFIATDGTKIHGEYYTHLFYGIPEIRKFQLIQESQTEVVVRIVTIAGPIDALVAPVIEKIRESLGASVTINIEYCEDIPPTASGKFLFTISKIES